MSSALSQLHVAPRKTPSAIANTQCSVRKHGMAETMSPSTRLGEGGSTHIDIAHRDTRHDCSGANVVSTARRVDRRARQQYMSVGMLL